ncbi:hypothetical protein [Gordonia sp. (in: high G+C Gram-positive bacteria)]|uniref:hypothetical protein n=1 Tax=Gordonia sp. (in: high G+C Gram-positive bacteria) TaxID=84139 RepID=UPI003C788B82
MTSQPRKPLSADLDPDGIVRLRRSNAFAAARTSPHMSGAQLLPGGLPIEQDIVWVFPALMSTPITPFTVRTHVRQAWQYSVGAIFHRAIITHARFGPTWVDGLRHAAQLAVNELYSIRVTDLPVVDVVAGLETSIDLFGPPNSGLLHGVEWGFGAEFTLASAYGDTFRQSSTDIVRYRSRQAVFEQEWPLMQHRLPQLTQHYIGGAYDIVAAWNDDRSLSASTLRDQARTLTYDLLERFNPI